jgi:hypothetical protein
MENATKINGGRGNAPRANTMAIEPLECKRRGG